MVKFSFMPRGKIFFELYEESAENMVKTAEAMKDMVDNWENIEQKVERIDEYEHIGDNATHKIIALLHRTFVTPIDREDIARLANSLDDVLDLIEAAGRACQLYHITKPTDRARELAAVILKVTHKLNEVMPLLHHRDKFNQILEECIEINRLENEADLIHHNALAELFDNKSDVFNLIKWREIYSHMESATDRAEDVANVLEAVVLKHA